ncbi:helix-turn-helix transcriptional regulator [Methylibium sp.]|uniref:helix-turn-helix domain-containing protein n=1 Tax=Methylibium sp. TaxID=2067992 RepID=UPI0017B59EEC|nr:helix-turn-helix transcriptional regulator [Methylibium sp.]MBA3588861.1 helix-turn-helix transcriptional regulator [Methylibium sp.]
MQYAKTLRRWLQQSGLTPAEAAPVLGVGFQTVYAWLDGAHVPPATRIPALAAALGVPEAKLRQVINRDRAARHARDDANATPEAIDAVRT